MYLKLSDFALIMNKKQNEKIKIEKMIFLSKLKEKIME